MSDAVHAITPEEVVSALQAHEVELRQAGIRQLSLFGSVARGSASHDSDVDLLAELDPAAHVGLFRLAALERRLERILRRRVDLLAEPVERPSLRASIERDRHRVF
jgi:predicted nucleotidyltransferase